MSMAAAEPVVGAIPPPPTGVDAALVAPRGVRVSWADVAGETGYRVERRLDGSTDPWLAVKSTAADVVSITNDGLLLGKTYLYRVVAFNEAGESAPSAVDAVTTPSESDLPPVPTGLRAELVAPRAIKLTWSDVAGETGYVIERRIDGTTEPYARVGSTAANVTTFTNEGLLPGKTYLYRVRSVNAVGPSSPSTAAFAATPGETPAVPAAPRLEISLVAPRAVRLAWTNVADESGYRIERRVDGSADPFRQIATTAANVTQYTDDGLEPGKTYLYRVRAFNEAGTSAYSNTVNRTISRDAAAPATPLGVEATLIAPRAARVTWRDVENERGYRLERRIDGSAEEWRVVGTVGANVTTFTQDGLLAGTTYLYRVRAFNDAGASAPSAVDSIRTPAEAPVPAAPHLEASLISPRVVRLAWTNVSNESGYKVERRIDGTDAPFRQIAVTGDEVTRYVDDGLEPGKTYLYRVRAFNNAGNSAYSNTVARAVPGDVAVPPTPTGVLATLVGPRAARVTWNDVAGERGYRVERRIDGSAEEWRVVGTVGANVTTFTQDGLLAGTTYLYRVLAFNEAGASAPSAAGSVRTPAEAPVPAAPHLEALLVSPRAVRLAWTNVSNENGYRVERRVDGTDGPFQQIAVIGDEVTRYVDDGLEAGKTYIYRVRAFNGAGNSGYSNRVAVAVPAPAV